MREYLFRGFHECKHGNTVITVNSKQKRGEWAEGSLLNLDQNSGYTFITKPFYSASTTPVFEIVKNQSYLVIPETVGQYIDTIEDNDIFANSIIKAYKYGDMDTSPLIDKITYRKGTYWVGNYTWIEFLNVFRCVEIIGNIFENPELLEMEGK